MLNEDERRQLDQIAAGIKNEDPGLAIFFSKGESELARRVEPARPAILRGRTWRMGLSGALLSVAVAVGWYVAEGGNDTRLPEAPKNPSSISTHDIRKAPPIPTSGVTFISKPPQPRG
jgi:hypothetical protein